MGTSPQDGEHEGLYPKLLIVYGGLQMTKEYS